MSFSFRLVAPEGLIAETQVDLVTVPNQDGQIGILAGHVDYIGLVGEGTMTITPPSGSPKSFSIKGGFVQVKSGQVEVLTDSVG